MSISQHYQAARRLALSKLIAAARKILQDHPNLDEFILAMGVAMFTVKDNPLVNLHLSERKYFRPVERLIDEWDDYLRLTGEGIRFRARGKIVRRW